MHILVTGGAGFIGSNLIDYHLRKGDKVLAVDDMSTGSESNLTKFFSNPNFRFEEQDILTWDGLDNACSWADRIYHMAAVVGLFKVLEEPIKVLAVNIAGGERLLRAISRSKWNPDIIMASTSEVYGNRFINTEMGNSASDRICPATLMPCNDSHGESSDLELREDMELIVNSNLNARTNYSVSKLADELYGLSYARQFGMRVRMVRFFNVVGPGQTGKYGMVVPRFVDQAVKGEPITVFGTGLQTRSFMDVRDTVRALDRIAERPETIGEILNVGAKQKITVKELAEKIKLMASSGSEITFTSYEEAYGEGFDEIYHRYPSVEKLNRLTRFNPEWTLDKTLSDLIARKREELKNSADQNELSVSDEKEDLQWQQHRISS